MGYNCAVESSELTDLIVNRLSKSDSVNEIITDLCIHHNMDWQEAKSLVESIRQDHSTIIAKRQFPLMTIIALGFFLGGIALLGTSISSIYQAFQLFATPIGETSLLPSFLLFTFRYAINYLSICILGICMILGSLIGMRKVWASILLSDKD